MTEQNWRYYYIDHNHSEQAGLSGKDLFYYEENYGVQVFHGGVLSLQTADIGASAALKSKQGHAAILRRRGHIIRPLGCLSAISFAVAERRHQKTSKADFCGPGIRLRFRCGRDFVAARGETTECVSNHSICL